MITGLLIAAVTLSACTTPVEVRGRLPGLDTLQPLGSGRVFLEAPAAAAGTPREVRLRRNDGPWSGELLVEAGDTVQLAFRTPPVGYDLGYRVGGLDPRGRLHLTEIRGYADGFPPRQRRIRVRPYRRHAPASE